MSKQPSLDTLPSGLAASSFSIYRQAKRLAICISLVCMVLVGLAVGIRGWSSPHDDVVHAQSGTQTLRVATTGADAPGCGGEASPCRTIQYAVDQANSGDEIRVAAGVYTGVNVRPRQDIQTIGVVTQVVYLTKTVALRGGYTIADWVTSDPVAHPTILDAQGQGRVLYISGNISSTIEGLRITGGNGFVAGGEICGGGVYAVTATVALSACQVYSNTAHNGGGMYLNYGAATLNNNAILSNTAYNGGGVYLYYGVATLDGNTFSGNKGSAYGGGVLSDRAAVALNGNVVVGNKVGRDGGGMMLFPPPFSGAVTLSNNHILSNTADMNGGGVNASPNVMVGNIIQGNTAERGGGLYLEGGALVNNVIADNRANTGSGLYLVGASDLELKSCNIILVRFDGPC